MNQDDENAGNQQQFEAETMRAEEASAAWEAHIAYCYGLYASRASGYGPGHTYEEHGPLIMGRDGKTYRETRLK